MPKLRQCPPRRAVYPADCWDLSSLFSDDEVWESAFRKWQRRIPAFGQFRGRLGKGPEVLAACLKLDLEMDRLGERLGTYAYLKLSEDTSASTYVQMHARFLSGLTRVSEASSFIRPEILLLPNAVIDKYMAAPVLAPYQVMLRRILRHKPHTLSAAEERLLAMQTEVAAVPRLAFEQLDNADLRFGKVKDARGRLVELTHSSFQSLLQSPDRSVRFEAFHCFYDQYEAHQHTLAATLAGSVYTDLFYARARNFQSCLEAALFPDNIPTSVYDSLISAVRGALPALHHYLELRRRKLRVPQLRCYDLYVPLVPPIRTHYSWDQAVELILAALQPLGTQYCAILERGLRGRWCDRYENQGKRSGAFSAGTYDGDPYILMNYRPDVIDHVFTLAHEAGHSMHSLLAARKQPYQYYQPVTFVAEIASTLNEELLSRYMLEHARSDEQRAFIINRQLDAIRGTIFRQTMFAEFEKRIHEVVENGNSLSVQVFRDIYHELLKTYLGPGMVIDEKLTLECLRIPHFYRAFYVYKYATGMSAAMALADQLLNEAAAARTRYLNLLSAGCSKDPLDLVRDAGVDMTKPTAIQAALHRFADLVSELEHLLR